ncbi:TetR family transcriptional regulator [Luteipulveratus sp. YIM 133132]|uniref:TetR/AcrR family transcriptional regulator n=1 Tax=Luteipulveratus flavus TaxID=3031728 RepID=UPI0023B05013|nr:TetR family transcriptional regulator [Luteipulveratus sp. YIM 133132]MDE9366866.1 TetR family transcriptional regulator [Luteipulveratus sp. YIM 133132]
MARHKEFDEQQALDQALETFWSGTYASTSTQDLCESTGLSRSSLYNAFSCKADLYQRSLRRYGELKDAERTAYLEHPGTGREALEALLGHVLETQGGSEDRRGCMVINAAVEIGDDDDEVASLTRASLDGFRDVVAQLIARGQDDGSIATTAPAAELATVVHAALNGLQVGARVATDPAAAGRGLQTLMSLL